VSPLPEPYFQTRPLLEQQQVDEAAEIHKDYLPPVRQAAEQETIEETETEIKIEHKMER
jgi:hypothetical protein